MVKKQKKSSTDTLSALIAQMQWELTNISDTNYLEIEAGAGNVEMTGIVTYFNVSGDISWVNVNDIFDVGDPFGLLNQPEKIIKYHLNITKSLGGIILRRKNK